MESLVDITSGVERPDRQPGALLRVYPSCWHSLNFHRLRAVCSAWTLPISSPKVKRRGREIILSARLLSQTFHSVPYCSFECQSGQATDHLECALPSHPLKKYFSFFLSCTCFQTLRLMGLGNTHIKQTYFCCLNKEGFSVQRPMFHLDKLSYDNRLWPGKKRNSTLCFPLCCSCKTSSDLWMLCCGDNCLRETSWRCFFESHCDEVDAPHLCFPILWEVKCQHSCWLCQPSCS